MSFFGLEKQPKTRAVLRACLEPFWDTCWIIFASLLDPVLCHFGALTMILALLCRDTVFGRFLDTVDTVKPSKNLGFSMVFDDFRDVDRCLIGTAKVSEMVPKGDSKWSKIGPNMVSKSVLKNCLLYTSPSPRD